MRNNAIVLVVKFLHTIIKLLENLLPANQKPHWGAKPYLPHRPAMTVQDDIATALGNPAKALIFQKIVEWCDYNQYAKNRANFHEDQWWTRLSYKNWAEIIHWQHPDTTRDHIRQMEKAGVLISGQFRSANGDLDKWYRVDPEGIDRLLRAAYREGKLPTPLGKSPSPSGQITHTSGQITQITNRIQNKNHNTKTSKSKTAALQQQHPEDDQSQNAAAAAAPTPRQPEPESGEHSIDGEISPLTPDRKVLAFKDQHRDGANEQPSPKVPPKGSPISPQAEALIADMQAVYGPGLASGHAANLIREYGEERVRAVHWYTASRLAEWKNPVAFLTSELRHNTLALPLLDQASANPWAPSPIEPSGLPDLPDLDQWRLEELAAREHIQPLPEQGLDEIATGTMTARMAWSLAYNQMRLLMSRADFDMWLKDAKLLRFDPATRTYVVGVRTEHAEDMLNNRHNRSVLNPLAGLHSSSCSLVFEVCPQVAQTQQPLTESEREELHRLRLQGALV